jgi:hypothetical protein
VEGDRTTWVFPAGVFFDRKIASFSETDGRQIFDLNLDLTKRGNNATNGVLLQRHRLAVLGTRLRLRPHRVEPRPPRDPAPRLGLAGEVSRSTLLEPLVTRVLGKLSARRDVQ